MNKQELRAVRLLEMLQSRQRLDVRAVSKSLSISEATTRRLFSELERQGKVIRVHGGVQLAPQLGYGYSFRLSAAHRQHEKSLIGAKAAELVHSGEHIFLDSGTTVLRLAEALALRLQTGGLKDLVVLTNSMTHLETLARRCKVILVGGEIRVERLDVCGSLAEANLALFHVNKAFLGADAVSLTGGFMTTDERTAKMNQLVVERSEQVYVLADSSKFGRSSFVRYASLRQVQAVYTDAGIGRETLRRFTEAGARIQIVRG